MKRFVLSLLISLAVILTACSAASSPTNTPGAEVIPAPTQFKPVVMLRLGLSTPVRLIPADLDPISQASAVIDGYRRVTSQNSEIWYGGTIQGEHDFSLEVATLSNNPSEAVRLGFPIHIKITKTSEPDEELNIISSASGAGAAEKSLGFPDIELQETELDLQPQNPTPLELRADQTPSVMYNFHATCASPGVYRLDFTLLPYTFTGADNLETQASHYFIVSLACPRSFTSWVWNGEADDTLEKAGSFTFQDGHYIPQP